MSKVLKNVAVFSLWLAGLVIMAHLLTPHDHHSDGSVFNKEIASHADITKLPAKTPVFPFHCHALNDLTFEKTITPFFVNNDIPACDLFTFSFIDSVLSASALSGTKIRDIQKPFVNTEFLRLSPFRAPPALA